MDIKARLSKWQKAFVVDKFDDPLRIACTGISAGKSYALSLWIVLQCLKKPGLRGIIIAQSYRALTLVLIREIKNRAAEFGIIVNHNKSNNEIQFENGSILYAFSAESPDAVLGLTEIDMLCIDESAYCNEEIYNNARDRQRGSKYKPMVRLISSPNSMERIQNWFSVLCKKYPECVIHATALDNPFTSDGFKAELKERYGEGSNIYKQQVLGEILDIDIASQIIFRHEFPKERLNDSDTYFFGMDVAGLGADNDAMVICDKYGVKEYHVSNIQNTFEKAGKVTALYNKYKVQAGDADSTGGYSLGLLDVLKKKDIDLTGVNFGQKAFDEEMYPNARTELYMEAVKAIKEGFWVPDEAKDEFLAQEATINNRGLLALVPKELVKKQLGHSPDLADAICLAIYAMNHYTQSTQYSAKKAADIAERYLHYFNMYG